MLPTVITLVFCICLMVLPDVQGHGRLVEPPSRSSMWRYGFDNPRNYNDNELYCGGFQTQWGVNGGKCGVCGDPWNAKRENEAGGKYANGIIVRKYKKGETITINIDLTANHLGYFQFRLCPHNSPQTPVKQECLDRHLLRLTDGTARFKVTTARRGIYTMTVVLPENVTCSQCVLQWKYNTGNSWGCEGPTCCVGCGPQEQFYGCADVAISADDKDQTTSPPSTSKTSPCQETTKPVVEQTTSESRNITKPSTDTTTTSTSATTVTSSPSSAATSDTTTSITDSTTDKSDENSDDCKATGVWEGNPKITVWCLGNCARGYCPEDYCSEACRQLK
ncbi:mucin-5AC-like [Haliotis rubra]|uniref:mucin-5AC-like n=1 Tax=Haliotis rubra TaxID=36100 RepID=UPI001EE58E2A|nr:mucin-5AC-like [Haliotis rubra]